ncbi:TRAP transporter small permease [Paradevosia shaoguanensis]|jgi:TRAP-type C4-dicarboxylate transport system permease small subunit|uniref:TRAP transporter small permease n=1 Tax=Paradevosia shaoguanensis TaxID=1335043 RepID=UPI000455BB4B|nr:TRAP transporter small permease [Paradevosia shaoguanensis]KFL27937.1 hypothetical protein JP74_04860 [Devosia sp. 17-2-E-8]QMV02437.1 TRAP transporter small permease subunit [Devosia sp. D6-9]CDP52065.1 TRAP-type transport system, large permease compone nt, predicted N-acetylneuraminate transporter [Devosia sp. DBB001]
MRKTFLRFERQLTHGAMWVACALFAIAACIGLLQIVTRFVFKIPTPWSEVTIRILLIWMVFLGIPAAFRRGAMISVDLMHRKAPDWFRPKLDILILAVTLFFLGLVAWWGVQYCLVAGNVQTIIGLEPLKMIWAYISLPLGCVLAMVAMVGNYLDPRHEELETAT